MSMDGFRESSERKRRLDFWLSLGFAGLALLVYVLTVSPGLYPGESAGLVAAYTGLTPMELPLRPVWGKIVAFLGSSGPFSTALNLNLFSALCAALSAYLVYRLANFFLYDTIDDEHMERRAPYASTWGAATAAMAFLFAAPVWQSAVRLQHQSFDLMLALLCADVLIRQAARPTAAKVLLFATLLGIGLSNSVMFVPLLPVYIALLVYIYWKDGMLTVGRVAFPLFLAVAFALGIYFVTARSFYLESGTALGLKNTGEVLRDVARAQVATFVNGFPRVSWLLLLLFGVVPWLSAILASFRAFNNERSWSIYLLHLTMTLLTVIGLSNSGASPWAILRPSGGLPVASSALLAFTAGYLVTYWYLLMKVKNTKSKGVSRTTVAAGDWMGWTLAYPLVAFTVIMAIVNAFSCSGRRGVFADRCAQAILDRLDGRVWFITDGTLDAHIQLLAREQKREVNLICLQNDMNPAYLKAMSRLIGEKALFADEAKLKRMQNTLELGILPFLQDWFAEDKEVSKKVAVYGVPDFWYIADCQPKPEALFFGGVSDKEAKTWRDKPLYAEHEAFWKEMDALLAPAGDEITEPVVGIRAVLRRQMGFAANNLGVFLEDRAKEAKELKEDELADTLEKQAFQAYSYVHETIDPKNISALFNRFEMARRGVEVATAQKEAIEHELKEFIAKLKNRYPLYSLSRIYGYVRSPEIFARLGWGWALSGQTGAALAGISRAIHLLPSDQRAGAYEALAAIYSVADEKKNTRKVYNALLAKDAGSTSAMLGLARLSIQEGSFDEAKQWLEKASKTKGKGANTFGVEWAILHLMNGEVAQARLLLQQTTDLQPKNLQAWALLAMVQIQQGEVADVEKVTIPKMESIAGTVNNYFVQIARAQAALKRSANLKGDALYNVRRVAREGFIRAASLKPEVGGVKDMILQLDIEMNDQKAAELHARQVLRVNRKHALANYVLGSLRLNEGQYGEAEDFLRRSVDAKPIPAALNDLAEVLFRIKKLPEAEKLARDAVKADPKLYVAWATLGTVLLAQEKDLNEAEQCVKKAIEMFGEDHRIKITLARIFLKKGEVERARTLIHQIKSNVDKLPDFDKHELENVEREASSAKLH